MPVIEQRKEYRPDTFKEKLLNGAQAVSSSLAEGIPKMYGERMNAKKLSEASTRDVGKDVSMYPEEIQKIIFANEYKTRLEAIKQAKDKQILDDYNARLTSQNKPQSKPQEENPSEFDFDEQYGEEDLKSPKNFDLKTGTYKQKPKSKGQKIVPLGPPKLGPEPFLFSKNIAPPTSGEDTKRHSKDVMDAFKTGSKETEEFRKETSDSAKTAKFQQPLLSRARQLNEKGDVHRSFEGLRDMWTRLDPSAKNADSKELFKIGKEINVARFRQDMGSKPAASEFFYIESAMFKGGEDKETIDRIINLQEGINELAIEKDRITKEILREYGEWPLNLDEMVEARLEPAHEKFLDKIGYYKWGADHPQEMIEFKNQQQKDDAFNAIFD